MRRDVPRRIFRGPDLPAVSARARAELGDDALVLSTRTLRPGVIEIVAADANDVARFERRLTAPAPARAESAPPRPLVIALVGPTGSGKTTSAVKLAVNRDAFGAQRVGFVTLDTFRAGAVAQLETYAAVARIPVEVAYDARDVQGALARLADRDVVIVDTPGRGPRDARGEGADWRALLDALAPDEVHLVLPATVRHDVARHVRDGLEATDGAGAEDAVPRAYPTHLLLTKLDEVPGESGVAELASLVDLPVRWVCDGQEIPADLAAGVPRIVRALGAPPLSGGGAAA
jgi:flagellar biosynthesis protein FlhF